MKLAWKIASWALTGVCVAILLAVVVVPRALGAVPLTVLSGSMQPTFSAGDMVIAKPVDPAEVRAGDIVTFQPISDDPMLITHRVVSVEFGSAGLDHFVTQGDANGVVDKSIVPEQVMGRYVYHVPYLGFLTQLLPGVAKPVLIQILGGAFVLYSVVQIGILLIKKRRRSRAELAAEAE